MAYFSVTDFNLHQTSDFCRGTEYARRETGVRSTDGASAIAHIPSVRCQISQPISNTQILTSRSVSLPSLCTADLPRESTRHRNLSTRSPSQALPLGDSRQHRQEHTRRCQRIPRLAHLSGLCTEPNSTGAQTLFTRQLCCGAGKDSLRTRYHDYRPVLERLSMGALSSSQSCRQDAYAARPARQYSNLHSHQRRQDARGQCARHPDTRSRQLLHHGSWLHRLRSLVHPASSAGVLCHPWQVQPAV